MTILVPHHLEKWAGQENLLCGELLLLEDPEIAIKLFVRAIMNTENSDRLESREGRPNSPLQNST